MTPVNLPPRESPGAGCPGAVPSGPVWTAALPGSSSLSLRVSFQRRPAALRREPPSRDGEPAEAALGSWGGRGQARVGPRTKAAGNERHLLLSAGGVYPALARARGPAAHTTRQVGCHDRTGSWASLVASWAGGTCQDPFTPQPHPQPGSELCLTPPPRQAYLWGQAHLRDRLTCDRAPHSHRGAAAHR